METRCVRRCDIRKCRFLLVTLLPLSTLVACKGASPEAIECAPTPSHAATWQTYASQTFQVTLRYPASWEPVEGYGERYGGRDGFFQVSAGFSPQLMKMDEACELLADHKLKPYGSQPQVARLRVEGQEACLILPSHDQPQGMRGEAALVVRYPHPVEIAGEVYGYFIMSADVEHIRDIAETVRFERNLAPISASTVTPTIDPAVTETVDCADTAPFAHECLNQQRPPELEADVVFTGILPTGPVTVAAWSPDGSHLAYAVTNLEPHGFKGLEVRSLPDFRLEGRWDTGHLFDLAWTPDGEAIVFIFDRGDTASIGLIPQGGSGWHDLLPGEKATLSVSGAKFLGDWLAEKSLTFGVGCGTGCGALYALEVDTGTLTPVVNAPGSPYAEIFSTHYLFSPDQRWLAATSWGTGLPMAVVLEWPGPAEPLDLSARLDKRYTEAQSWTDDSLAFVAYPPGVPDEWSLPPRPDLYIWDTGTEEMHLVSSSAFQASFAPTGDRLAVLYVGEPGKEGPDGRGSILHLNLLSWPEGQLLAAYPVSTMRVNQLSDLWHLPTPIWSPQGEALALQPVGGGLALMSRDGEVCSLVTSGEVSWVGWGADGNLALLINERMWLVRV